MQQLQYSLFESVFKRAGLFRSKIHFRKKEGKDFRKYLAKQLRGVTDLQSEKLALEFLNKVGVEFIAWPYNWKNPDLGLNVAVLDDKRLR